MSYSIDMRKAMDKLSGRQYNEAVHTLAREIRKEANSNIHNVSGRLAGSAEIVDESLNPYRRKLAVVWKTPYARRVNFAAKTNTLHFVGRAVSERNQRKYKKLLADEITKG